MSSETSTERLRERSDTDSFSVAHFFVLLSLLAATVAVLLARPSTPAHLVLISLTIGTAGIAAIGVYRMVAPLIAPHIDIDRQPLSERMRLELEREKALTLRSIKELEFDRAMGKVSAQDFDDMAARLRSRALGIMRQLDDGSHAYRALIEKELEQRVGKTDLRAHVDRPVDPPARPGSLVITCTCGTKNDTDARFCKGCGSKLVAA